MRLLVSYSHVADEVDGVVGSYVEPVERAGADDVLEVQNHQVDGVNQSVRGVETVRLSERCDVLRSCVHAVVLKTFGKPVEPGLH